MRVLEPPRQTDVADFALPTSYRIFPHEIDLEIPGFSVGQPRRSKALATEKTTCDAWYTGFVDQIVAARSRSFLPVCRMSDGEYLFALGHQPPDVRRHKAVRLVLRGLHLYQSIKLLGGFCTATGRYYAGQYRRHEVRSAQQQFAAGTRRISQDGILALHLSYGATAFQEHYFPALSRWLQRHRIALSHRNYVPFHFVYGALTGPRRNELLHGRVLVVNCATGAKRAQIIATLQREGATEVHWCTISDRRALFDRIDMTPFIGKVDIAFVGAGIGKIGILNQMAPLKVPCIDAGFVIETWANPECAAERPYCLPTPPGQK